MMDCIWFGESSVVDCTTDHSVWVCDFLSFVLCGVSQDMNTSFDFFFLGSLKVDGTNACGWVQNGREGSDDSIQIY